VATPAKSYEWVDFQENKLMNIFFSSLRPRLLYFTIFFLFSAGNGISQETQQANTKNDSLMAVAREIMKAARYCALITVDESGQPYARTMDPFWPDDDMVIWFGTNPNSRKVKHILHDSRVVLYYFDSEASGYVSITGIARLVNDAKEKALRWKKEWQAFYPDRDRSYLLIAVEPKKLEVVSEKHNITGDLKTWTPPAIKFKSADSKSEQK